MRKTDFNGLIFDTYKDVMRFLHYAIMLILKLIVFFLPISTTTICFFLISVCMSFLDLLAVPYLHLSTGCFRIPVVVVVVVVVLVVLTVFTI